MKKFDSEAWQLHDIRKSPLTEIELDALADVAKSYEAIFSKRARKVKELNLDLSNFSESDYKKYLLLDYTFLKRPILQVDMHLFIGSSKATLAAAQEHLT